MIWAENFQMNQQLHIVIGMIINSSVDFPHIPTIFFIFCPFFLSLQVSHAVSKLHQLIERNSPLFRLMNQCIMKVGINGNQWVGGREYLPSGNLT